jgi:hypothetical protein
VNSVIDLLGGQTPAAHRHVIAVEDLADCAPLDTEPGTQLVHRLPTPIPGDEFLNLVSPESARPTGS